MRSKRKPEYTGLKAGAYLTLYAALSLTVLLSLFLAVLEGVRVNTIQLEAELIADIGMDSVLAEYHRELFNQYGMFWIDTSYGTAQPSIQRLEEHLKYYVNQNCSMNEVFLGDYLYRDFLAMEVGEITVLQAAAAGDDGGSFFRERAVEAVKNDIGLSLLEQIADWLETVETHGLGTRQLEQEMQQVDGEITDYDGQEVQVGEDWITLEVESPVKVLEEARRKGILNLVIDDMEGLSEAAVNTASLISSRRETGGINQGNWEEGESSYGADALMQRLLWQEYLFRYCGFYGSGSDKGLLRYQVEYLIAGKDNDIDNLKSVVHRICGIREAANALYLFSDEEKCAEAEAAAAVIASALLIPEAELLFQAAILLGWAYAESLYDVSCLLKGQRVPLLKTAQTWHYGIEGALEAAQDMENTKAWEDGADTGEGLAYQDYLRLLLAISDLELQTFRMMDIVEMDIRQTPGNGQFRLDGCIDRLTAEICVESAYGYSFTMNKRKEY